LSEGKNRKISGLVKVTSRQWLGFLTLLRPGTGALRKLK